MPLHKITMYFEFVSSIRRRQFVINKVLFKVRVSNTHSVR